MGFAIAVLRALSARPALRAALFGALALAVLGGAVGGILWRLRADAARDAIRAIEAEQSQGVKDAIKRAAPGPRPVGDEFLECLRRGGPGCL